jgi:hypothetical protein
MKKIILLASLIMLCFSINAQSVPEIKPSVNATQFISGAATSVGLHTGQPTVSIPLFNLQGKGINVPISVVFNGENITHESEASNIGLGWSLMAGGVITATIRDRDDQKTTSAQAIEWQYNDRYLENMWDKQQANPYTGPNEFDLAMGNVLGGDSKPDSYNYSFLGYSGEICFKFNNNNILQGTLYPDNTFKLEKTTNGYKITTDDGIVYYFEYKETNCINSESYTTSFFLSEIKTMQGGHVVFSYENESMLDFTTEFHLGGATGTTYPTLTTRRLTRIDYDYGYVTFGSASRDDIPGAKRITNIELHNSNGVLIKGYELNNDSYLTNANVSPTPSDNYRMKLNKIREYNQINQYLPPYEFQYESNFQRSKSSYRLCQISEFNCMRNTWAMGPGPLAIVDRNIYGEVACWSVGIGTPNENFIGFSTLYDYFDETVNDNFYLKVLNLPSGGSESYTYEPHDYRKVGQCTDYVNPASNVSGSRLSQKIIADNNGNRQIVEYRYCLHNENYEISAQPVSSGILINPSIHSSVMYKPVSDASGHSRFVATPYTSAKPQNGKIGSPVYYTEVEEVFRSSVGGILGKKIYYFERCNATPAGNYVYVNYNIDTYNRANILASIPNSLYGKQQGYPSNVSSYNNNNYTYMAYPVGQFCVNDLGKGKVLKEITLNTDGKVVRKVQNEYLNESSDMLYGLIICPFDDNVAQHPEFNAKRYLISKTTKNYGTYKLQKTTTTDYFPASGNSIESEQTFSYTSGNRLQYSAASLNNGEKLETEYVYPDNIIFNTTTNLSAQASSIKQMLALNMINSPIQLTKKKGGKYVEGIYSTFKQLNSGAIVVDTVFSLKSQLETSIYHPEVKANGKIEHHSSFLPDREYLEYDVNANPLTIKMKDEIPVTYRWGYAGQYPIAKIENYTQSQLQSNSALLNQLELLDDYTVISTANKPSLLNCNQAIRNSLPANALITTFTYNPLVGMTSATDPRGVITNYNYDSFNRLYFARNHDDNIVGLYRYGYKNNQDNGQGGYTAPTAILYLGAINHSTTAPPTATATVSASGGSGSYTYSWYLLNSGTGSVINSLTSPSPSYTYTCSETQNQTVKCVITDNTTGQTVTTSKPGVVYTTPAVTVSTNAATYDAGSTGTATATVSGGSGDYTYYWCIRNSSILASAQSSSASWQFTSSQGGPYSIVCTVRDNIVDNVYITASTNIIYNGGTTGSFTFQPNFYGDSNSLSVSGSLVTFTMVTLPASSAMVAGTNYFVATVPDGFQPYGTRTFTYYTDGRTWQVTFNPDRTVYLKILSGNNLSAGNTVYIGTQTYNR